jgi:amino acid transporter
MFWLEKSVELMNACQPPSFGMWIYYCLTVVGMLVLRVRQPALRRPIKVCVFKSALLFVCFIYLSMIG